MFETLFLLVARVVGAIAAILTLGVAFYIFLSLPAIASFVAAYLTHM